MNINQTTKTPRKYLCIGGPLHGQRFTTDNQPEGYDQFNCGTRWPRTEWHRKHFDSRGITVPETMVFLWVDFFRDSGESR
jgi:hypothetical protein